MREFFIKLSQLDRRWVFLGVAVCTIVPFFFPMKLEIIPTPFAEMVYAEVDKVKPASDPESKPIILSMDYDPGTEPEIGPMAKAILRHIFARKGKVIVLSFLPTGAGLAQQTLLSVAEEFKDQGIEEGVHWVYLGFNLPPTVCMQSIGVDIRQNYPKDFRQVPIDDHPLMKGYKNYDDTLITICLSGTQLPEFWIINAVERFGARFAMGVTNIMSANYAPTIPKQSKGMLTGMRGAAEYEQLMVVDGYWPQLESGARGMDSQSVTHGYIILLIILGNVGYFLGRKRRVR